MEYSIHSPQASFWRDAYLAAMRAGHPDPAAAADEAFLAFDCRFIEPTIDGAALVGAQMAQHVPQFGSNACDALNSGAAGYAASVNRDYEPPDMTVLYPSPTWLTRKTDAEMLAPLTADELVQQANEIETTVPSVVVSDPPVQDPSTGGLQSEEPKTDDEVLG